MALNRTSVVLGSLLTVATVALSWTWLDLPAERDKSHALEERLKPASANVVRPAVRDGGTDPLSEAAAATAERAGYPPAPAVRAPSPPSQFADRPAVSTDLGEAIRAFQSAQPDPALAAVSPFGANAR